MFSNNLTLSNIGIVCTLKCENRIFLYEIKHKNKKARNKLICGILYYVKMSYRTKSF